MRRRVALVAVAILAVFTAAGCYVPGSGWWGPGGPPPPDKAGGFWTYKATLPAEIPVEIAQDCYVWGYDAYGCADLYHLWLLEQLRGFGF